MDNLERLKKLFTEVFGEDIDANAITPNDRLAEDLQMNSIGYLYMALAIENEFGIRLTNKDFEGIRTVGDVLDKLQ
ncbi:MAG: hypothetical protein IJO64_05515 [Clostridia bacterium]|nr:hypothetical protein [Clostridia bacterium]